MIDLKSFSVTKKGIRVTIGWASVLAIVVVQFCVTNRRLTKMENHLACIALARKAKADVVDECIHEFSQFALLTLDENMAVRVETISAKEAAERVRAGEASVADSETITTREAADRLRNKKPGSALVAKEVIYSGTSVHSATIEDAPASNTPQERPPGD